MLRFFLLGNIYFMKKLLLSILILVCISSTLNFKFDLNPIFSIDGVEKVCFVTKENVEGFESVRCGDNIFNFCTLDQATENLKTLEQAKSFQLYFSDVNLKDVFDKLKFEEISVSEIGDIKVYCGYTPYSQKSVLIDGKKINVQISAMDEKLIVGFPMILTGY